MKKKQQSILKLLGFFAALALFTYAALFGLDKSGAGSAREIKKGLDLAGGVSITYEAKGEVPSHENMADTRDKLQKRVEAYSTESEVYLEGNNRITIDIPGATDANAILKELGKPGTLIFCTDEKDPQGSKVMDGQDIADAQPAETADQATGGRSYVVSLTLNKSGQEKFSKATAELAPKRGIIYVIYDNKIVSAPTVQAHITGDKCEITGMKNFEEAKELATTIRIGALKVELQEIRSTVVGAKLGVDSIKTSLLAGAIGLVLVVIFMIAYYRIPGLAASLALLLYTALMTFLISIFDITLTLPGIAGIILSIGMAVDANCVIFSRLREEVGLGNRITTAIENGFSKALSAIMDGNITTLIAAFVLYFLGSGPVKGFASTLALGVILSMFTALFVTRTILTCMYYLGIQDEKFYGKVLAPPTHKIVKKRVIYFLLSGAFILAGLIAMMVNAGRKVGAMNYSLEFKGGTSTTVTFNEHFTPEDLENKLQPVVAKAIGSTDIQMSPVVNSNEVIIKTQDLDLNQRTKLYNALKEKFNVDESKIQNMNISATVSKEMRQSAILAVAISSLMMLIYIWFRFKDFRFGASSVFGLLHDCMIVVACYALFRWTVGNTFIACMLTIIGYSINATIIIFDRIRENTGAGSKKMSLEEVVDLSTNQTLSRSINTSLTTFIMVTCLYILGVTSVKEFALPLMVGIACGTYSSVAVSTSFWYVLRTKVGKKLVPAVVMKGKKK